MELNFRVLILTIINIGLLVGAVLILCKVVKAFRVNINKNKEIDKKLDDILEKLDKAHENK